MLVTQRHQSQLVSTTTMLLQRLEVPFRINQPPTFTRQPSAKLIRLGKNDVHIAKVRERENSFQTIRSCRYSARRRVITRNPDEKRANCRRRCILIQFLERSLVVIPGCSSRVGRRLEAGRMGSSGGLVVHQQRPG